MPSIIRHWMPMVCQGPGAEEGVYATGKVVTYPGQGECSSSMHGLDFVA